MARVFHKAHALVIAVANYQFARRLPSAILNDASDFAAILCSPDLGGYDSANVRVLLDGQATAENIRAELGRLRRIAQPDETVCIYFSGHGSPGESEDYSRLLSVEATKDNLDGTSISAPELSDALHGIAAARLLVVLDACHAGGAAILKGPFEEQQAPGFSQKSIDLLSTGVGRAVLASCRTDEMSLVLDGARNSAFTAALLEGLRGAADFHSEGVVKLFGLFEYAAQRATSMTGERQHPVLNTKTQENFAIALNLSASKGVPLEAQSARAAMNQALFELMPALYPFGPNEQNIWERAGGDVARLRLGQSGRSQWFEALKLIEKGGGGSQISLKSLILEAIVDFPYNENLRAFS